MTTRSIQRGRGRRAGNAVLEFTLVGLPMLFLLVATLEMARAMWTYHTVAYAAKEGVRYAIVHGNDCVDGYSACPVTLAQIATVIRNAGIGLDPSELQVTFGGSKARVIGPNTLDYFTKQTGTYWPVADSHTPDPGGKAGSEELSITLSYPFRGALAMFWTGVGPGQNIGALNFPATAREMIQF